MAQSRNILLGKITKIHGVEGAVAVRLEKNFSENIPLMESVFLEIDGRQVPFFIDYFEHISSEKAYLKFQDYNTIEKIKEFTGCNIFVSAVTAPDYPDNDQTDLLGFKIVSPEGIPAGDIVEIIKNPGQWLLRAAGKDGGEILIPLHEDLIISVDEELKTIVMNLPEGLEGLN